MNIRFFLLNAEESGSVSRLTSELKYIFFDYLADNGAVQTYTGLKAAAVDVAKAVEDTHVLVFLASYSQLSSAKLMLSKAFGFSLGCDSGLLKKANATFGRAEEQDSIFAVTHAYVPPKSNIFVLGDGSYAGFAVANGNQHIVLLPLAQDRTAALITSQVIPYINSAYKTEINADLLKKYHTERLAAECASRGLKLAVAGTKTSPFFENYVRSNEALNDTVKVSSLAERRGNMPPVDYIVNLSITAAEFFGCEYGAAMSNAYYTGSSPEGAKTVYLAVTNERETYLREEHSLPGEDILDFLSRCSADLCAFVVDVLSSDAEREVQLRQREKTVTRRYKKAIAAAVALICAACLLCGLFFSAHGYSLETWYNNFTEWLFPGGVPFSGSGFGSETAETSAGAQNS